MEEKSLSTAEDKHDCIRLGMSSFGPEEREQFGRKVRLAMACIEGSARPVNTKAMPDDEDAICQRLKVISRERTSAHADLLELLVRFDDLQGWKHRGANHCAAWMNLEMGISPQLGWEYLRVGRKLRTLPTTTALFRAGKLSWSKIRLIVNVATTDNEKTLCHAALDASFTEVKRICNEFRWDNSDDKEESDNDRAMKQWASRSLTWDETSIGSTRIQLVLPPEVAQAFLNSVEHSLQVEQSLQKPNEPSACEQETSISQRRADAAVLMAETSLQAAGRDIATADRYQVIVSVDSNELSASAKTASTSDSACKTPAKKPTVKGAGPIARETARRIACDCSIATNTIKNGEPTDIGRISRIWPRAMARAIKDRDQHCQFNGCTRTHNLKIHHIVHWADGGTTCIENGVSLCQSCHTKVHEGGYTIQRVDSHEQRLNEQFEQQTHADDPSSFNFEKDLRNDRESFDKVRSLSPTRYRFRVLDSKGRDIRHRVSRNRSGGAVHTNADTALDTRNIKPDATQDSSEPAHSTRVECAEPMATYYRCSASASRDTSTHAFRDTSTHTSRNTICSTLIVAERRGDYCFGQL